MNFASIEKKAEEVAVDAGVFGEFPVNLEVIASHLGYEAYAFDADKKISGAIHYDEKKIYINKNDVVVRQRFTLAHEIGHAVLHEGQTIIDYRSEIEGGAVSPREREANHFAANLLMPRIAFSAAWRLKPGDVSALADFFGVSKESVRYRATNLCLA